MKVVLLCGGQGTRMREETEFKPKPLVEIGGKPIVWHIMKTFAHHGLKDFVLCLGYKGDLIKHYFLHYESMNADFTVGLGKKPSIDYHAKEELDMRVTLADTGLDTMTGARVKRIAHYVEDDDAFIVTYGDGVADVDIEKLLAFHRSHGKLATVTAYHPVSRYGVLDTDGDRVTRFAEKPQMEGMVSMGFFVFQKEVLKHISDDPSYVMEKELLQQLAHDGELMAYRHEGFFYPMDTYRDYLALNEMWKEGNAPWAVWEKGSDTHSHS